MNKFELEIQIAKDEIVQAKKQAWVDEYRSKNPNLDPYVDIPLPPDFVVKAWFTATWDTGFVVVDLDELKKMPKRKREKILSLGGL